ncbi:gamma-glutamylcyclotransferase family protein [Algoriphagus mannitolivorans]|uniref:gamma-glutamylcyclotransferase family protein n=1 Tax=Algoriphagus mannitolivorans TaxID=226504 RepID=UPI0003F4F138|nr:gamma-glutamylcyclotransferase family protein [Algoriphagus mannitolivorans]
MKILSKAFLHLSLILILLGCKESKKTFVIPEGHVGMFGYGSLMSKKLIETGLLEESYDGPFLPAHILGYKRSWSFVLPTTIPGFTPNGEFYRSAILVNGDTIVPKNLLFLNIRQSPNTMLNGVLYIVPLEDLPTYDSWELGYERFEVTDLIQEYEVKGGPVFAYKAHPDFYAEPTDDYTHNIIEQSYWEIILDAFEYWGKDFEAEYYQSTDPVSPNIIQENLQLPWINPPVEIFEELKKKYPIDP